MSCSHRHSLGCYSVISPTAHHIRPSTTVFITTTCTHPLTTTLIHHIPSALPAPMLMLFSIAVGCPITTWDPPPLPPCLVEENPGLMAQNAITTRTLPRDEVQSSSIVSCCRTRKMREMQPCQTTPIPSSVSVRGRKIDCDSSDGPMHRAQKQKLEVGEID